VQIDRVPEDGWHEALDLYQAHSDDDAGRKRPDISRGDDIYRVRDLCNELLTRQLDRLSRLARRSLIISWSSACRLRVGVQSQHVSILAEEQGMVTACNRGWEFAAQAMALMGICASWPAEAVSHEQQSMRQTTSHRELGATESPWQPPGRRGESSNVFKARLRPNWFDGDARFWYRNELPGGRREFILVDAEQGTRERAFDHERLAQGLTEAGSGEADPARLALEDLEFHTAEKTVTFRAAGSDWRCHLETYVLSRITERTADRNAGRTEPLADDAPRASLRTGPDTELIFLNRTDGEVELFWLEATGRRRSYGRVAAGGEHRQHTYAGHVWEAVAADGRTLAVFEADEQGGEVVITSQPERRRRIGEARRGRAPRDRSPDGKWRALVRDGNVFVQAIDGDGSGDEIQLSDDGAPGHGYDLLEWSPDSQFLVAFRVEPGDEQEVFLIESSPPSGGRAQLHRNAYALPGDKYAAYELNLFQIAERTQAKPDIDRIDFGRPRLRWNQDGRRFTYEQIARGHQRFRLIEVDAQTGAARNIIDETSETFLWTAHAENVDVRRVTWLEQTDEIIYASERDGWRHLYLMDAPSGTIKSQITKGEFVVRGVDRVDEDQRQVWFRACGMHPGQDPYLIHYYRVNFDGTGLVVLTEGHGNHSVQYSPNRRYLIDTHSRVDQPPLHELRRVADGKRVCELEQADVSQLRESGWQPPEVFVAKGRDGQTEIWGIICRPRDFDPTRKYPILEDIYAGPQGSFVPKSFSGSRQYESLTELGFIVVKIDGMGTAHRSKAFHDVCWKNLKDAGLPDRIAWIKAAAAKYPSMDLNRVGVYGTSAGGQNAAGAVLFHPDFYKAAVASCGCHDNRMDKASWNEQWMGYPVGPQYAECSNIDNAWRLQGKLLLIVGEMDTNVPPESTLRFADALIKADKDFEMLVIPGAGHGNGGAYGRRRMQDFFVRHLQPKPPPPQRQQSESSAEVRAATPADVQVADSNRPPVTAPPESFFELVREDDREVARQFYGKYVDCGGLPVVAAAAVADEALHRTHEIVTRMLAGRPDVLQAMVQNGMYLIIIGKDQVYTDMPEYRNHPNPAYQNERVRGTGGKPTSFGEENLLSLPLDRYDDESIAVHEFCHTIDGTLRSIDPSWNERRNAAYRRAMDQGLWRNTYAASNPGEFWAEIAQSYFNCNRVNNWNHGPIGTREQLRAYDPVSYALAKTTFNLSAEQDWSYRFVQRLPNVTPRPTKFAIDPYYTKFTWAREFPVVGRHASDEALLKANDTIRKLFAYRHDILKALIADGLKLVVLGSDERLGDLPEFHRLADKSRFEPSARVVDYDPELKLLAVGAENILDDSQSVASRDSQVIRVLARAIHGVTARRPVDPDWDKRGRAVQQYELRVKRLDIEFDNKLQQLHEAATSAGKWQGSPSADDRVDYWAAGVLAYFDATNATNAADPTTREALRVHDPGLYALVHETMAYEDRADWRYQSAPSE